MVLEGHFPGEVYLLVLELREGGGGVVDGLMRTLKGRSRADIPVAGFDLGLSRTGLDA